MAGRFFLFEIAVTIRFGTDKLGEFAIAREVLARRNAEEIARRSTRLLGMPNRFACSLASPNVSYSIHPSRTIPSPTASGQISMCHCYTRQMENR